MNYLVDTHIFLWLLFDPDKLGQNKIVTLKDPANNVHISSISFFEISLKYQLGKLDLKDVLPERLPEAALSMNINIIEINAREMASFYKLPKIANHKDPFDRMIIWSCICNDYILMTQGNMFKNYLSLGLKTY